MQISFTTLALTIELTYLANWDCCAWYGYTRNVTSSVVESSRPWWWAVLTMFFCCHQRCIFISLIVSCFSFINLKQICTCISAQSDTCSWHSDLQIFWIRLHVCDVWFREQLTRHMWYVAMICNPTQWSGSTSLWASKTN